jgi:NAD+ kinase
MNKIGFVYNALVPEAPDFIESVVESLGLRDNSWVCSAVDVEAAPDLLEQTTLIVVAGGDGTILRTIRAIAPYSIPIVGVNMGRVGFMSELRPENAAERLPDYLSGHMRIEHRMMLHARVTSPNDGSLIFSAHALNDVVVGRGGVARLLDISTRVDGAELTSYRADAVIISTATGSTGYALSAGGPIFFPEARLLIMQPVAAHTGLRDGLVLPDTSVVELSAIDSRHASLSVDGLDDIDLEPGAVVTVDRSSHEALFLRSEPPTSFYADLTRRLGLVYNLNGPEK